jgi:hypothetical protein
LKDLASAVPVRSTIYGGFGGVSVFAGAGIVVAFIVGDVITAGAGRIFTPLMPDMIGLLFLYHFPASAGEFRLLSNLSTIYVDTFSEIASINTKRYVIIHAAYY